jgi:hypothetical protein
MLADDYHKINNRSPVSGTWGLRSACEADVQLTGRGLVK